MADGRECVWKDLEIESAFTNRIMAERLTGRVCQMDKGQVGGNRLQSFDRILADEMSIGDVVADFQIRRAIAIEGCGVSKGHKQEAE